MIIKSVHIIDRSHISLTVDKILEKRIKFMDQINEISNKNQLFSNKQHGFIYGKFTNDAHFIPN